MHSRIDISTVTEVLVIPSGKPRANAVMQVQH
jgi:hypothetical protein